MHPARRAALSTALLAFASCTAGGELAPDAPPAERARAALEEGDWATVRELAQGLVVEAGLSEARARLAAGETRAAWEALSGVLELEPKNREARDLYRETTGILLPPLLDTARARLLSGDSRGAMIPLDEAIAIAPDDAEALFLRGESILRMGVEDGNAIMFEDARAAFHRAADAGAAPEALVGAARAGWLIHCQTGAAGDLEQALAELRQGMASIEPSSRLSAFLSPAPLRTGVEIRFASYTSTRSGVLAETRRAGLFEETRTAIEELIGSAPTDGWAWTQLANLYQWEGRLEDARDAAQRGVQLVPGDPSLHEAQVRTLSELGGWDEVVNIYEEFVAAHPDLAIGHWNLGRGIYEMAMASWLDERSDVGEAFRRAEGLFRRARELDPAYRDACLGYEATSRSGQGWTLLQAGDLDAAADAFRSMEELFPGGLRWEDPGRLWSGMKSLAYLAGEHNQRWLNQSVEVWKAGQGNIAESPVPFEERFPHLLKAVTICDELFAYDPEDPSFANNAGFFNRDAGVAYHGRGLRRLAADPSDEAGAQEAFAKAAEHMEKSYAAYVVAASLAPDDARVINDTGLILTYYLHRELDDARRYLEDAIAVGIPQLEAGIDDEEQRTMTREAVGDAYQNLGVIALTIEGDAAAAKPFFEKSLEYERSPRFAVTELYLPLCDMILAGELDSEVVKRANSWADLDLERARDKIDALKKLQALFTAE